MFHLKIFRFQSWSYILFLRSHPTISSNSVLTISIYWDIGCPGVRKISTVQLKLIST